jgi:hypothetical protein
MSSIYNIKMDLKLNMHQITASEDLFRLQNCPILSFPEINRLGMNHISFDNNFQYSK